MSHLDNLTAVIIAGGLGTRLGNALGDIPKALAPVAGQPFISHLLDQLAQAGLKRAVLCTGHGGDLLEDFVAAGGQPLELSCSREPEPLGTGGALRRALPMIEGGVVLAMNGDSYVDTGLADIIDRYCSSASAAAMVLVATPDTSRFGSVAVDANSQVTEFIEKRAGGGPGLINGGIYLLSRQFLSAIPAARPVSLEREVFPAWIGKGLEGYPVDADFIDIGTPESLARAEDFFARRERS